MTGTTSAPGCGGWRARVTREMEDNLIEMIDKYDGKPIPTTPGLVRSWATGRVRRREASRETIYCAELVATTTSTWACCRTSAR